MANIGTYSSDIKISALDKLLGTDGTPGEDYGKTKNYTVEDLANYLNLVFTVDSVNYNLNTISTSVSTNTTAIATANQTLSTHTSDISANSTFSTNLATSFGTYDSNGNLTSLSQSFANDVLTATSSDRFATSSSVTSLSSTVTSKPEIFRQNDAPPVTNPVGSIWYDTNDNNKVYVLVSGTPNVWTETTDDRIITNSTAISTATDSISTLSTNLGAESTKIEELETQFTFTNGDITGVAGAINTSISTAQSSAESASATKVNTLASTFYTGYDNSDGTYTSMSSAFADQVLSTQTTGTLATASSVNTLEASVDLKPDIFRQDNAPAVTEAVGSIWYDTNDNNKVYILVSGSPNVWTETSDDRITTNTASITENASVIAEVDGYAQSRYSLQTTAGGVVTGMSILSESNGTYSTDNISEIKFQADRFIVNSSSTNLTPFSIVGSKIKFNGDIDVSGTVEISGAASSGDFIAALFKNTDTTNSSATGISLQSSSDYHHKILMVGGNTTEIVGGGGTSVFDLNARYTLGKTGSGAYNKDIIKLNGAGLIIPNQTANSITVDATNGPSYAGGMNIIFNNNDGGRDGSSGRIHVNEYYKTFFLDVPGISGSSGTYQDIVFAMRAHNGTGEQTVFEVNTSRKITTVGAVEVGGAFNGQNGYFVQNLGIGFSSGNIGGNFEIRNGAAGEIAQKINLGSSVNSSTVGSFIYTAAEYTSDGMFVNCQANNTSGDNNMLIVYLDGDVVNKNNSYTQYSDQSLKENIVDATDKLEDVKQIRVRNFNLIGEDLKQIGVIAQELETIFPALVKERKVPGHENPVKTVKYSVLVPILIKAIQELEARVTALEP